MSQATAQPAQFSHFREILMALHALVTAVLILATYLQMPARELSWMYFQGQLVYSAVIFVLIARLKSANHLLYPAGVFVIYTYFAYFLKSALLFDQDLYLRNWITIRSPLAHATFEDWALATSLTAWGLVFFAVGYWFLSCLISPKKDVPATRRYNNGGAVLWLLMAGAGMVALRVFVTWGLGAGASFEASGQVFLIPGLTGFLALFTLWGSRLVITAAFAMAATSRSTIGMLIATGEMLALGVLSTVATGSKSEVLLPIVVLMLTGFLLRHSMNKVVFQLSVAATTVMLVAVVTVYPAFHHYRYLRNEMDILTYLERHQSEMSFATGSTDVLRRLNGLEYMTLVVAHYEIGGVQPSARLNYQPFIVNSLFGVPDGIPLGLGVGPFGGMLLLGGWSLFPLIAFSVGIMMRVTEHLMDWGISSLELRVAALGTLSVWLLTVLMFSGHFIFIGKELFSIAVGGLICSGAGIFATRTAKTRRPFMSPLPQVGR